MNIICLRIEVCHLRRHTVMWCGCWNHRLCTACPLIKKPLDAKSYSDRTRSRALWRFSFLPGQPDTACWWLSDSSGSRKIVPQWSLATSRSTELIPHDWNSSGALQVSSSQESNRTAPCRITTPWHLTCFSDLSSYFDFFIDEKCCNYQTKLQDCKNAALRDIMRDFISSVLCCQKRSNPTIQGRSTFLQWQYRIEYAFLVLLFASTLYTHTSLKLRWKNITYTYKKIYVKKS